MQDQTTNNQTNIVCPNCHAQISIEQALYSQLEEKFNKDINEKREAYKKAQYELKQKELELKKEQEKFDLKLQDALKEELKEKEKLLRENISKEMQESKKEQESKIKEQLQKENEIRVKELEDALKNKSAQVQELEASKAEIAKLKMEKEEIEAKTKSKVEVEFYQKLTQEKQKAIQEVNSQNELKLKEADEKMRQLQEQLQIAQRKAEQGSMQMQGEVQELAIENYLSIKFPLDTIEEIKKGQRGADCMQIVNTTEINNCGKIYYESKRTKEFQKSWIEKFKADMRDKGADVGVLITSVLPKELDRMGFYDGVWVCTFDEFKGSVALIRNSLIQVSLAKKSQDGKSDKMSLLYSYLTSNEFSMQVEAIVEGFTTMQNDLQKEKNSMARIWKQREKQLDKVLENTISMYGSIKGIAGNAIGDVKALKLEHIG